MFILPKLDYSYDALEPFIDGRTMEIHYTKHHQTYVDKLNDTVKDYPNLMEMDIEELLTDTSKIPDEIRQKVINFGGGHANHSFFWKIMGRDVKTPPVQEIISLKEEFNQKALTLFGSGWTWIVKKGSNLEVTTTINQDSPLSNGNSPILGIDLWEHAYYLKFQNRRNEYIDSWWNVINWEYVFKLLN